MKAKIIATTISDDLWKSILEQFPAITIMEGEYAARPMECSPKPSITDSFVHALWGLRPIRGLIVNKHDVASFENGVLTLKSPAVDKCEPM